MKEFRSLVLEHRVWDIRALPIGRKPLSPKWVHLEKSDGTLKSLLVARGFSMIQEVDYDETFSPVAKLVTFRIFLTLVACYSLHTCALDVKTAFLNAEMDTKVWMKPPDNLEELYRKLLQATDITPEQRKMLRDQLTALKNGGLHSLLKALYGTKNAGRLRYLDIDGFLKVKTSRLTKQTTVFTR